MASFTLFAMDDHWLSQERAPSFLTVPDSALHDSIDLEQASLEMVFEGRSDALRFLAHGEIAPPGGLAEWDGSDCYMGFVTAQTTARIAEALGACSAEKLIQDATWIDLKFVDEISRCLQIFYADLKDFIERASEQKRGLACLLVN